MGFIGAIDRIEKNRFATLYNVVANAFGGDEKSLAELQRYLKVD